MPDKSSDFFSGSRPIALIAGGAGFIGSAVAEKLLQNNVKVICLDNWQTGLRENVTHLTEDKNFLLVESDITRRMARKIPKLNYILHLAGLEAYLNGEDVSIETLEANSTGTKNLLELAIRTKARFLLGSSIDVFNAKLGRESVDNYFGETRRAEGEYSHREAKRFAEALVSEYAQKKNVDTRIVRLGSVYGPKMLLSTDGFLARIIKQALYKQPLEVGKADAWIYPVFIDDAVEGLLKILMSTGTKNSICTLAGEKTSLGTIGQLISQIRPESKIIYTDTFLETGEVSSDILTAGKHIISWEPKTEISQGLEKTISFFEKNQNRVVALKENVNVPKKKEAAKPALKETFWGEIESNSNKNLKKANWLPSRILVTIILISLSLLFWIFVLPVIELGGGLYGLQQAREKIAKGESENAGKWAARSAYLFSAANPGFEQWRAFPGLKNESKSLSSKSKLLSRFANLAQKGAGMYAKTQMLFTSTLSSGSGVSVTGSDLAIELASLEQEAAFLDAEMGDSDFALDLPLFAPLSILTKEDLDRYRKLLGSGAVILNQADDLLGIKFKKTYLVLFQNNTELRPTGGFIGSFGLVTFEKGHLSNFEIQDVYSADGQLKGHVDAPKPLVDHLGEEGWYLRDSNWNPDFPTSAARAIWFIDKELDKKVDGVIAIDLEFAKKILNELGGLELPDFGEMIYADNLYEKAESRAENNFFPGSRAKKDYLTAIGRGTFQKITQSALTPSELAKIILASLEEKHLLVWTDNAKANATLKANGWDGSVRNITCPVKDCIEDYLYIVEANLGVNKSNYFLERKTALDINTDGNSLLHTLTITYKNNSQLGIWPGGDYKNYLRLYAPAGSEIGSATLSDATSDEVLEIDETVEKGKNVFGMLATVPAGESRELRIKWTTPLKDMFNSNIGELLFLWQKQPGTLNDPLTLRLNLPKGSYKVAANPTPSLTEEGSIGYNTTLSRDLLFDIAWQAK